ncbi:MAG: roadblock/LC7 domain-containing protein [Candidatus Heimdallarchaeota archaeon]|nr:roadblock/LC7 domain-containing protein [Candidatus Heimdallarchaeota archaeon]
MDVTSELHRLILKTVKTTPGIRQMILSDTTGLILTTISKERPKGEEAFVDFEGVAAISSAMYLGLGSKELDLGDLGFSITEFSYGRLFLLGISKDYVLSCITNSDASPQSIKVSMRALSRSLSEKLDLLKASKRIKQHEDEFFEKAKILSDEEFNKLLDDFSF